MFSLLNKLCRVQVMETESVQPEPKCPHPAEDIEWIEHCRATYDGDPAYADTKLLSLEKVTAARRRCRRCGAVEKPQVGETVLTVEQ